MKIRQLVFGLAFLGMASTIVVGGAGLIAAQRLSTALTQATSATQAVRAAGNADMMHDAVRSDVLATILAVQQGDIAGLNAARDDMEGNGERLLSLLSGLQALPLPPEVAGQIATALPVARQYVASARHIQELAATDSAQALKELPAFSADFDQLEASLVKPGEGIEAFAQGIDAAGQEASQRARLSTLAVTSMAMVLLLTLGWRITSMVDGSLQRAIGFANHVAQGNLGGGTQAESTHEMASLMHAMDRMQSNLAAVVIQASEMSSAVAAAGAQIATGNQDLAHRTEEQAATLQSVSQSMTALESTLYTNSENTSKAKSLAGQASDTAERGGQVVAEVVHTMHGISESSRKIGDIIGVIDGIAFQTNILALNAAVEAARAGEAGRGFAVVASEVRNLAGRSGEAAKQIKSLINASMEQVVQGTELVDQAGQTMEEVVTAIRQVTEIVAAIDHGTELQRSSVMHVAAMVEELAENTQQNTSLVEESAAAAAGLRELSGRLVDVVAVFKLGSSARMRHMASGPMLRLPA